MSSFSSPESHILIFLVGCLLPGGRVTQFQHFTQFLLTYYPLLTLFRPLIVPFFVLSDFSFHDSINSDGKFFQLFSSLLLYLFFFPSLTAALFFSRQNKGTSQLLMHCSQQPIISRKAGI